MNNFLMGKGYWDYVEGEHEETIEFLQGYVSIEQIKTLKYQIQGFGKFMYGISISVINPMIGHI